MKIRQVNIFTYHLPLQKELRVKDLELTVREGAIVQITADQNSVSFGEVAPLPGLHTENLDQALSQMAIVQTKLTGAVIPKASGISGYLDTVMPKSEWMPAVRFGIEAALLELYMTDDKNTSENIILPRNHDYALINILADGNQAEMIKSIRRGLDEGCQAVKVKVGRKPVEDEANMIINLFNMIKGKATLRLDANRSWDLSTAISFMEKIKACKIEYIEEPLKEFEELPILHQKTGISLALDENIRLLSPTEMKKHKWIDAIILKPSAHGSIQTTLDLIHACSEKDIKCVLSDTFHSGIGLLFLLRIASTVKNMVPMGFDTYSWLGDDILKNRLVFREGCYNLHNLKVNSENVDFSKLREFSGSLSLYETSDMDTN